VGNFAGERAQIAAGGSNVRVGKILHPAPANPEANKPPGWSSKAAAQLQSLGVWK
jgi:single-strand selective monofunctional uracil DNA glycosylase